MDLETPYHEPKNTGTLTFYIRSTKLLTNPVPSSPIAAAPLTTSQQTSEELTRQSANLTQVIYLIEDLKIHLPNAKETAILTLTTLLHSLPNGPLNCHGHQHGTLTSTPNPTSNLEQQPTQKLARALSTYSKRACLYSRKPTRQPIVIGKVEYDALNSWPVTQPTIWLR